ncbi:ABC transporter substrate-binding protein [Halobacteriales archaeon SW_7_68_16]|nr:MAG: ABC transporter substrate-binding protein [Halobacteriales archaeon SW_7_68_16]
MARRNLARNRLRSLLAALGIGIGVLAIASLGIFGNVLRLSATNELGGIGTQVIVSPNPDAGFERLSTRDVRAVRRVTAGEATAVPLKTGGGVVTAASGRAFAQLYGTSDPGALFSARAGELPDRHRQGAIVGANVADSLALRVGSSIEIQGQDYRVIAILEDTDTITPIQPNQAVVLPEDALDTDGFSQIVIGAESGTAASRIADEIADRLNAREDRVTIFELSSIVTRIADFFSLLNAFLIGLASISLVVAGVSIFNVMLMSTSERREEIGVLRAVGVDRADVLRTLLAEATLLGAVGGLVGATVSGLLAAGLEVLVVEIGPDAVYVPTNGLYLVGAFGFGIAVALASGLYPAWRAASERPVDALRG